jgi:hypothetical protein
MKLLRGQLPATVTFERPTVARNRLIQLVSSAMTRRCRQCAATSVLSGALCSHEAETSAAAAGDAAVGSNGGGGGGGGVLVSPSGGAARAPELKLFDDEDDDDDDNDDNDETTKSTAKVGQKRRASDVVATTSIGYKKRAAKSNSSAAPSSTTTTAATTTTSSSGGTRKVRKTKKVRRSSKSNGRSSPSSTSSGATTTTASSVATTTGGSKRTRLEHNYTISRLSLGLGVACVAVSRADVLAVGFVDGRVVRVSAGGARHVVASPRGVRVARIEWAPSDRVIGFYLSGADQLQCVGVPLPGVPAPDYTTVQMSAAIADFCFLVKPSKPPLTAQAVVATREADTPARLVSILSGSFTSEPLGKQGNVQMKNVQLVASSTLPTSRGNTVDLWCTSGTALVKEELRGNYKREIACKTFPYDNHVETQVMCRFGFNQRLRQRFI